jgi:hypothetical protein
LLELERSEVGERGTPGKSDIRINVAVKASSVRLMSSASYSSSYSAADQSWVMGGEWDRFLLELRTLDEQRQGRAVIEGASPDDLRLEFYSTDSAGHMAVRGHRGEHKPDGHLLQLRFGFSFEPDQLPGVVQALCSFRT